MEGVAVTSDDVSRTLELLSFLDAPPGSCAFGLTFSFAGDSIKLELALE